MRKLLTIAAALAAAIVSFPSRAIDYEPLDWVPLPRGTHMGTFYYEYGEHDSYNNTIAGTFDGDTHLDSDIGIARFIHYNKASLFGHEMDWNVLVPFGTLRDGRIDQQSLGSASGVGDPVASIGYFLVDKPERKRWFTIAPYLTIPIGSYDEGKPLNLGGNRWVYNFQGDFTQGITEKIMIDLSAGWTWYGDNDKAGSGHQKLEQDASYELYGWLIFDVSSAARHVFRNSSNAKFSLGYMGLFGGKQKIEGVLNGQKARQDQLRLTYMMNLTPKLQALVSISGDTHVEGQFKQNFGLLVRFAKAF
ncbi:MAG TPA: transporter [Gammaproteobacteria bacterium]|nr:transporter [Gammaproteobacteria bacterium]